eukprot:7952710-Pyramimonas_sp.AAC.1
MAVTTLTGSIKRARGLVEIVAVPSPTGSFASLAVRECFPVRMAIAAGPAGLTHLQLITLPRRGLRTGDSPSNSLGRVSR